MCVCVCMCVCVYVCVCVVNDPVAHHETDTKSIVVVLTTIKKKINTLNTERSENARDNFDKFIHQFQRETKTLIRKL